MHAQVVSKSQRVPGRGVAFFAGQQAGAEEDRHPDDEQDQGWHHGGGRDAHQDGRHHEAQQQRTQRQAALGQWAVHVLDPGAKSQGACVQGELLGEDGVHALHETEALLEHAGRDLEGVVGQVGHARDPLGQALLGGDGHRAVLAQGGGQHLSHHHLAQGREHGRHRGGGVVASGAATVTAALVVVALAQHHTVPAGAQVVGGRAWRRWGRDVLTGVAWGHPTGEQIVHVAGGGGTLAGVGGQQGVDGGGEGGRQIWAGVGQGDEGALQLAAHGRGRRGAVEGRGPRGRQVEHRPEAVQIAARVGPPSLQQLGGHEARGAHHGGGGAGVAAIDPGQAEVGEAGGAVGIHQHIGGGHVPVHHPLQVRGRQGPGQASAQPQQGLGRPGTVGPHVLAERLAGVERHRQGEVSVELMQIQGDQGRLVAHPVGRPDLAAQAGLHGHLVGEVVVQQLEGHLGIAQAVVGQPHRGGSTPTQFSHQFEAVAEHLTWRELRQ